MHHWNKNNCELQQIKHPDICKHILEYRFFFFFFDFFFSRRGEGEGLSELLTDLNKSQIFLCHEHISIHMYFLTCLCSYFSFSSSDCASLEENQTLLNLPTIWGSKGIRPWVKDGKRVEKIVWQEKKGPQWLWRITPNPSIFKKKCMALEAAIWHEKNCKKRTYISVAAASLSPDVPALSSPSLSPCGPCGRKNHLHNR